MPCASAFEADSGVVRVGRGQEAPISTALSLVAVGILVLANGFFVATEFSLVAVRRTRIQHLVSEGDRRAKVVLGRLDHLDSYIAATQLGITIASLALGWIGEPALSHLIEPLIENFPGISESNRDTATRTVGFILAFSVITTLHIVFGELAPKSLALQRPEATALAASGPIHIFYVAFRPIIAILNSIGNNVVRLLGIEPAAGHERVQSAEELMLAISASRDAGLVNQSSHDIVDRAFIFADLAVRHVMVPRTEMTAVRIDATLPEILQIASKSGYTRLPVYERDVDHLLGILNIKRVLPVLAEAIENGSTKPSFPIPDHISPLFLVPATAHAAEVLERMRRERVELAVVVDEYGGTAGIVTLEDLVESLVGDIQEEGKPVDEDGWTADGRLVLDGMTSLVVLRERYGLDLADDETDVETLGGYVFARLGRPGEVGDEILAKDRLLRVEEMDNLRVARVSIEETSVSQNDLDSARDVDSVKVG